MANQLKASWGVKTVSGSVANVQGVVTDFSRSVEPSSSPLQSETGTDIGHTVYDKKKSVSATVMCKNNAQIPEPDSIITIAGEKYYVDRAEIAENNQSYTKFTLSASRFVNEPKVDTDYTV